MNKLRMTLVGLAVAALAAPAHAGGFGVSVRGDVGPTGSQVPYFQSSTVAGLPTGATSDTLTEYSNRKNGQWDFSARVFWYMGCMPCNTYVAAAWQGSKHTVKTNHIAVVPTGGVVVNFLASEVSLPDSTGTITIPAVTNPNATVDDDQPDNTTALAGGTAVASAAQPWTITPSVSVENKFSKGKLGFGIDLATCCKAFTLSTEFGVNYLQAELNTVKTYKLEAGVDVAGQILVAAAAPVLGVTSQGFAVAQGPTIGTIHLGNAFGKTGTKFAWNPSISEREKTEGVGLYASLKGEYKFADSCFGNCFSVYAKAEISDIIGRQSYKYLASVEDTFAGAVGAPVVDGVAGITLTGAPGAGLGGQVGSILPVPPAAPTTNTRDPVVTHTATERSTTRYSNIVEVDLEAAFVYSPCIKCWDNMQMNFAVGVRTDSFVNLFSHTSASRQLSLLSLTRPTLFIEVGIKV